MPISDRYKVIFVHIPKTGGTSIERMLQLRECKANLFNSNYKREPVYQHFTPDKLKALIPKEKWDTYYKFVTVRHPLQRALSDFKFFRSNKVYNSMKSAQPITTFSDYCKLAENIVSTNDFHTNPFYDHFIPQYYYFNDIIYNKVCRFETFINDIEDVKKSIGCISPLKHVNSSSRIKVEVTPEDISIIERVYAQDYEQFGYERN